MADTVLVTCATDLQNNAYCNVHDVDIQVWLVVQADSASTLRGYRPSYREILLRMRDSLAVDCPGTLATQVTVTDSPAFQRVQGSLQLTSSLWAVL